MSTALNEVYHRVADHVRQRMAAAGKTWVSASYLVEAGRDSLRGWFEYRDRHGAPALDDVDMDFDVFDLFKEARALAPNPDGRRWTWARLTFHADGRHEAELRYPVPPPEAGRRYSQQEIIDVIAACVRNDLSHVDWAEAWVEVGGDYVPFIYYRGPADAADARTEVNDTDDIARWLELLWAERVRTRAGTWSAARFRVYPDGRPTTAEFDPRIKGPARGRTKRR